MAWHRLDPWPDSVAGLTRLKRKFILATMSNGNVKLMVVGLPLLRRARVRLSRNCTELHAPPRYLARQRCGRSGRMHDGRCPQ